MSISKRKLLFAFKCILALWLLSLVHWGAWCILNGIGWTQIWFDGANWVFQIKWILNQFTFLLLKDSRFILMSVTINYIFCKLLILKKNLSCAWRQNKFYTHQRPEKCLIFQNNWYLCYSLCDNLDNAIYYCLGKMFSKDKISTHSAIPIAVNEVFFPIDLMRTGPSSTLMLQQSGNQVLLTPSSSCASLGSLYTYPTVHLQNGC